MKTSIYIPRRLMFEDFTISEDDACTVAECIVVLAEPGAGKTRLLLSLAEKLGSKSFRANVFRRDRRTFQQDILIIDGLDEVAKIDCSAIEEVFCRVGELAPKRVIFASRSSEWDEARNRGLINDFIGLQPKIVRLLAFDEVEQRSLFKALFPDEDFFSFQTQAERFELAPLLGNPLFLDLFAKAYVENNRVFESKERIFSDAIRSLAEEHNSNIPNQKARPDTSDLVLAAEDIFAKLLLSGASGVAVIEAESDRNFPYLLGISKANKNILKYLLDTNLFKLADTPSLNEPVHRIVAEYCAANYLAKRIRNSHDHLTLRRCLSVIAPNGVVRTELRGLLGWLAALGDEATQLAAIDLDPYAILANGDSVLLSSTSKTRLLFCLKKLEVTDPYFRHSDKWRQFNVKDFFTKNIVEETKQLLSVEYGSGHLRGLLLELLTGSSAVNEFEKELEEIVYNECNSVNIRELSNTNLLYIIPRDHKITFRVLLHQGGNDALMLASRIVTQLSVEYIGRDLVGELFLSLQYLYPKEDNTRYNVAGSHYFIKQLIESISLSNVIWLLDLLSQHLKCSCEAKYHHQCHCRNGSSKIVGYLLDRYFSLEPTEIYPVKIWKWIRNVNFHSSISQDLSYSVKYLLENSELRHAIHILAFEEVNGFDDVWALRCQFSGHYMHSGLFLNLSDARKIVDYAFSNDNIILWRVFFQHHDIRRKDKDDFRANMRIQS
ncbi:TPA: hypothetical protein R1156_003908, partial [Yersinia enterocolitica]|nr:hypothetical protein [Yersinia enterocolitica]